MEMQSVDDLLEKALQLHTGGQLGEAEQLYRQVLRLAPEDPDALHLLGALMAQQGNAVVALDLIDRAIQIDPTCPDFYNNKGLILLNTGRYQESAEAHRKAIELNPQLPEAHNNLGNALVKCDQLDAAAAEFAATIALKPDYARAHTNLGVVYHRQNKLDEAIACYRTALKYEPNHAESHSNLGVALRDTGHLEEAIAEYRAAIAADPNCVDAHANLGAALHDAGRSEAAIVAHTRAIELNPNAAPPHYNLAVTLLQSGDFTRGFAEYESRAYSVWSRRQFGTPPWDGQNLGGRSILIHGEGGLGDAIQFCRFIPMVKERRARVILQVQPELVRLFGSLAGTEGVVSRLDPLPQFDVHCPLLSLPKIFGTTLETIPSKPYLSADAEIARRWGGRFFGETRRRIGIAWTGSPKLRTDHIRSIPLEVFSALSDISQIRVVSLQQDHPRAEPPTGLNWDNWMSEVRDFADLAGVVANLDVVVSVDTAVAHLAGAMGKKVYLLLPSQGDWRWLRDRTDSPWYPSMTIIRQPRAGDWLPVMARLVEFVRSGTV
jgi:tetratricopeptide (TPR) repeat protein